MTKEPSGEPVYITELPPPSTTKLSPLGWALWGLLHQPRKATLPSAEEVHQINCVERELRKMMHEEMGRAGVIHWKDAYV